MLETRAGRTSSNRFAWIGPGRTQRLLWSAHVDSSEALQEGDADSSEALQEGDADSSEGAEDGAATDEGGEEEVAMGTAEVWIDASNAARWIGEDGGAGARTGLASLLDDEEIGAAVLPPTRSDSLSTVFHFAMANPTFFLFVPAADSSSGEHVELSRPLENVALVRAPKSSKSAVEHVDELIDVIVSRDFEPTVAARADARSSRTSREQAAGEQDYEGWSHVDDEIIAILAWRRRRGLDRSIDFGTRWVVFESALPSLVRSVDRDLRGFLRQLALDGLFRRRGGWDVYVGFVQDAHDEQEGRLVVRVSAELSGEYRDALARPIEAERSIVSSEY